MSRATLTVVGGGAWRPVGVTVDLLPHEDNIIGLANEAVIVHGPRLHVRQRRGRWWLEVLCDNTTIDGVAVASHGDEQPLQSGQHIVVVDGGLDIDLRFEVLTAAPLERLRLLETQVLIDCGSPGGPGRWWSIGRGPDGITHGLLVGSRSDHEQRDVVGSTAFARRENDERALRFPEVRFAAAGAFWRLYRNFPRGVSVRSLVDPAEGAEMEPAVTVAIIGQLAARMRIARHAPRVMVGAQHAWLGFDGSLQIVPPLQDAVSMGPGDTGHHLLVDLLRHLMPEPERGGGAIDAFWHRMIDPRREPPPGRRRRRDDILRPAQVAEACAALVPGLRPVDLAQELRGLVCGLWPDEWEAEQTLAEELAMLDNDGFDALLARTEPIEQRRR